MRILFFMNILRDGAGMINREISYAEQLVERNHTVKILSYFKPTAKVNPRIKVSCIYPTKYIDKLYDSLVSKPYAFINIFIQLFIYKPEIVMVDLPGEARWAVMFRRFFNYKVIFTYHGVADPGFYSGEDASKLKKLRDFGHNMLKKVDRVIVVSDFLQEEVSKLGIAAQTLHNGFDQFLFNPTNYHVKERNKLVFIGRFTEYKGAFNVVKAFARVNRQNPKAKLEMFGHLESPEYLNKIKAYIDKHSLSSAVKIAGPLTPKKTSQKMKECGLFINGSVDETFCMPLLEAQACGTPCIAFAAGGIPEVVNHGETGLLAPANDVDTMAQNIEMLLNDNKLYNQFVKNTHTHSRSFNYRVLAPQLENTLVRLCSDKEVA